MATVAEKDRREGGCHWDKLHHEVGQLSWGRSEWMVVTRLSFHLTAALKSVFFIIRMESKRSKQTNNTHTHTHIDLVLTGTSWCVCCYFYHYKDGFVFEFKPHLMSCSTVKNLVLGLQLGLGFNIKMSMNVLTMIWMYACVYLCLYCLEFEYV